MILEITIDEVGRVHTRGLNGPADAPQVAHIHELLAPAINRAMTCGDEITIAMLAGLVRANEARLEQLRVTEVRLARVVESRTLEIGTTPKTSGIEVDGRSHG